MAAILSRAELEEPLDDIGFMVTNIEIGGIGIPEKLPYFSLDHYRNNTTAGRPIDY